VVNGVGSRISTGGTLFFDGPRVSTQSPPQPRLLSSLLPPPLASVDFAAIRELLVVLLRKSILGKLAVEVISTDPSLRHLHELFKSRLASVSAPARSRFLEFVIRHFSGSWRDRKIISAMTVELKEALGSSSKYFLPMPHEDTPTMGVFGDEDEHPDCLDWINLMPILKVRMI